MSDFMTVLSAADEPSPGAGWVALGLIVLVIVVAMVAFGGVEVLKVLAVILGLILAVAAYQWISSDDDEDCQGPAYDSTAFCFDDP